MVEQHDVGKFEDAPALDGDQLRIARPRADKIDLSRSGAGALSRLLSPPRPAAPPRPPRRQDSPWWGGGGPRALRSPGGSPPPPQATAARKAPQEARPTAQAR